MLQRSIVSGEHHRFGGSGAVLVARSENLGENELSEYMGKVQIIVF